MTETKDKRKPTAKSKPDTLVKALIAFHETRPTASQNASGVWGTYADINQVIDTVRGACQFGLTFTQEIDFLDHNPQVNYIRTILMHESGESQVSRTPIHVQEKDRSNPQKHGAGITYAKRYGLCAAFGLPTPDDDADDLSNAKAEKAKQDSRKKNLANTLPDKQPEEATHNTNHKKQPDPNAWARQE